MVQRLWDHKPDRKRKIEVQSTKWKTTTANISFRWNDSLNTLGLDKNGQYFVDGIFKYIFLKEIVSISIKFR